MNKFVMVFGAAAVATLAGCKDPAYNYAHTSSQNEPKDVAPVEAKPVEPAPVEAKPAEAKPAEAKPAEAKPVETKPAPVVAAPAEEKPAPEFTVYIVQNGDYLARISKKFNITIAAIKKLNNLTSDTIRVGQKLKLPGKVDVGEQKAPVVQKKAAAKFESYKGATTEYVVKSGDTLGAIAYSNGCNIRQLKELNGLKNDFIKIGQKLKVPAGAAKAAAKPVAKPAPKAVPVAAPKKPVEPEKPVAPAPAEASAPAEAPAAEAAPAAASPAPAATAPAPAADEAAASAAVPAAPDATASTVTYAVQEGDDLVGISIRFGVSEAAILELNNLAPGTPLSSGMLLKLPAEAQQ